MGVLLSTAAAARDTAAAKLGKEAAAKQGKEAAAKQRTAAAKVGGHGPAAGGLAKAALKYLDQTQATAIQVYVSNPRGWALNEGDPQQDEAFVAGCAERGAVAFVHASLLVNLGSPTALTVERSVADLDHALRRGKAIGARGVVFHAGSAVDAAHAEVAFRVVRDALLPLLDRAAGDGLPPLLVEPSAGGGRCLAARVEDLEPYLAAVDWHPHLGVCFDTCHAWAAGHDLAAPGGMTATLDALVQTVGADRLRLIHANDSKDACGSTRDRHETLGSGSLGEAAFAELTRHPVASAVPLIVETPSEGGLGHASDIALLRSMVSEHIGRGGSHDGRTGDSGSSQDIPSPVARTTAGARRVRHDRRSRAGARVSRA